MHTDTGSVNLAVLLCIPTACYLAHAEPSQAAAHLHLGMVFGTGRANRHSLATMADQSIWSRALQHLQACNMQRHDDKTSTDTASTQSTVLAPLHDHQQLQDAGIGQLSRSPKWPQSVTNATRTQTCAWAHSPSKRAAQVGHSNPSPYTPHTCTHVCTRHAGTLAPAATERLAPSWFMTASLLGALVEPAFAPHHKHRQSVTHTHTHALGAG